METIVVCCAVLYNIACQFHNEIPIVDVDIKAAIELGNIPAVALDGGGQNLALNNIVRHSLFTEYFQILYKVSLYFYILSVVYLRKHHLNFKNLLVCHLKQ